MATLKLQNVSLDFPLYEVSKSLRSMFLAKYSNSKVKRKTGGEIDWESKTTKKTVVHALKNIDLSLTDGDRVAIIGHNGAGKTTMLKVMAGIYWPTRGDVRAQGSILPMFGVVPGLSPEDNGYENIQSYSMFFRLTPERITEVTNNVEETCGLGEYLSLPVRTYSSGMQMRLAFSLMMALEGDIMLLDEELATGDTEFHKQAHKSFIDKVQTTKIVVLATHSQDAAERLCKKAMLIEAGEIVEYDSIETVFNVYSKRAKA